ncbi:MAG: ABC transporter permease [Candidatus Desantisbacteria bacterium]
MKIHRLIFRNMTSRKIRFCLTISGVVVGIASVVVLLSLSVGLENAVRKSASGLGANLIVTPKGWCAYEQISVLMGEQVNEAIENQAVEKIAGIQGLIAAPMLTKSTAIDNNPVTVVGIVPEQMIAIKGWGMDKGEYLSAEDTSSVVIGAGLSAKFNLKIRSKLRIRENEFMVKGILAATGTKDDTACFIPLKAAQKVYETSDAVSFIAVKVDDLSMIDYYSKLIKDVANVDVVKDEQLINSVLGIITSVKTTMQIIALIAILAGCFGIANTMMTAVYERRREIGILQAVGAKKATIFKLFMLEGLMIGFLGGIGGILIGGAASYLIVPYIGSNEFTAFLGSGRAGGGLNLTISLLCLILALFVSFLSALFPAYQATKLTPVEAMRYE